ncbi:MULTISPECIES: peptidylprolyl isomerase [Agrobacterium]|uniref:Parvulin-like PPIase n=2 Tax=Agrobacterium tumefaciens TaxID=358 RepID=A0A1S7QTR1_AGRTU|nr:peptidylprolyl isomerase [Agrobacterium tumefaciens]AYM81199.1 peptidyl-prolyl cis-trans isomerase D [Agrobacterium tumefaciens]NTA47975.1 peptidylprolyl isomerase [Agrobacterium tumefaciens]NTE68526.1 peptidylprolyl isomerase [Agrobacterium tumefaciens]NTE91884.1 peptidylprolyl isomerase [Agrobacterium tumefaciens]CUX41546.1 peptidyl-prolyl cis-trans isomerse D [Agrobacterium tumefaciens str. Kerr 14]
MLDSLRNASRTMAAKLLLLLLVVSFGVWGVSASLVTANSHAVMTVGDQTVSPEEFRLAYQRQISDLSRQFGTRLTTEQAKAFGIDRQVFSQLAAGAALDELAAKMNLGLSENRLANLIAEDPAFKSVNGQFDRNLFSERLRNSGFREDDYIKERSKVAVRSQIVEAVSDGFAAPQVLVDALKQYRNEQRSVDYVILSNAVIPPVKAPGDDVLTPWFETNKTKYRAPEFRKFTYVKLEPSDIADQASVTDAQIADYYNSHKDSFRTAGRRTVEQLTFPEKEMAEAAAEQIRLGNTTYDQVVKDQGKAASDVTLGEFTKDTIPDQSIADAAFAIQKDGGVSPVVEGSFGPVLLRVTGIKPETTRTLEEAKEDIRKDLATAAAAEEITNVHDRYEDLRAGGSSLADAATQLNLKAVTIAAIDASGLDEKGDAIQGLPSPQLAQEVFKTEPGTEALPINLGREGYIWFDVDQIIAARDRTLAEVRDDVVADWTAEQQRNALAAKAEELKARVEKGDTLEAVAGELSLAVEQKSGLRRTSEDAIFGRQTIAAVFSGAEGVVGTAADAEGSSRILFKVTSVDTNAPADALANDDQQFAAIARAAGDDMLDQMVNRLQNDYGVTINQALADQAMVGF